MLDHSDFEEYHPNTEAQWISLSDLMTGMMMLFLLVTILLMIKVEGVASVAAVASARNNNENLAQMDQTQVQTTTTQQANQQVNAQNQQLNAQQVQAAAQKQQHTPQQERPAAQQSNAQQQQQQVSNAAQLAVVYDQIRHDLYNELAASFQSQLNGWGAEITPDLTVRFNEPDVLFAIGKDTVQPRFQKTLSEFFPRYVKIITSPKYKDIIQEVRIEGHTSSVWKDATSAEDAYFKNMELSQARTRSTLHYVLDLPEGTVRGNSEWLRSHVTANGLSSSHLIRNGDGTENLAQSQRVEFRIRTNADAVIASAASAEASK